MGFLDGLFGRKGDKKPVAVEFSPAEKARLIEELKKTELFSDLPAQGLETMFSHMETLRVEDGRAIIQQGEEGDFYYVLARGKASILRAASEGAAPAVVASISAPTGLGEEALISNAKRNATVKMTGDGLVLRLSKEDFNNYVKEPLMDWVSPAQAQQKIAKGAKWLDVREGEEAKHSHLHGAVHIPMRELRTRLAELDKGTTYLCYCENGRSSSTAAFILRQRGYEVGVLRGGLQALKRAGVA